MAHRPSFGTKLIDLHCDSVSSLIAGKDLGKSHPDLHVDIPRLKTGGVGIQVFAAYVPPNTSNPYDYVLQRINAIDAFSKSHEQLVSIETYKEAAAVMKTEKTGIIISVENGLAISDSEFDNSIKKLEELRKLKVRIMTLVHSEHLDWIASCTGTKAFSPDIPSDKSQELSRNGEKLLDAMDDLGIIPDLSHTSEKGFWDVIKHCKKPIMASHSCAHALCSHPRNLKDDQLKALGDTGGIVGINFFSAFLSQEFLNSYMKNNRTPDKSIIVPWTIIADHIDHMVKFAGIDSVALGSDFDGISSAPNGVTGSDFYPVLEEELIKRNYTEKDISKIFYKNFLRLFKIWDK